MPPLPFFPYGLPLSSFYLHFLAHCCSWDLIGDLNNRTHVPFSLLMLRWITIHVGLYLDIVYYVHLLVGNMWIDFVVAVGRKKWLHPEPFRSSGTINYNRLPLFTWDTFCLLASLRVDLTFHILLRGSSHSILVLWTNPRCLAVGRSPTVLLLWSYPLCLRLLICHFTNHSLANCSAALLPNHDLRNSLHTYSTCSCVQKL